MFGDRLRELRQARGLTQGELAARAAVSRQLIGSVEQGRHLPRVDAAVALAAALGVTVESLQHAPTQAAEAIVGRPPAAGSPVRVGRVGDRLVCAATAASPGEGWGTVDGVVTANGVNLLDGARPGIVVIGCDPSLGLAARLVGARSPDPVLAVGASTADAVAALASGRTHACVVHGREGALPDAPVPVARWHLARWQVGLGAPSDSLGDWVQPALAGTVDVIQRSPGAGSQAAFEHAVDAHGGARPAGPTAAGHVEAAWLSTHTGMPAVTIGPAALAMGLAFHALEEHVAQLWVSATWTDDPGVRRLGDTVTSAGFRQRLAAVGGYDLADIGTPVAA